MDKNKASQYKIEFQHYRIPVEKLPEKRKGSTSIGYAERAYNHIDRSHFSPYGGVTVCQVRDKETDTLLTEGWSNCSLSDNFCYKTGRQIALGRALKKLSNA